MFFYRLGHIPELALAEFNSLKTASSAVDTTKSGLKFDSKYLLTNQAVQASKMGSVVYSGKIYQKIESADDLAQVIADLYDQRPVKKLGISINAAINSKKLIQLAHEVGFKKINILHDKEPNAGHFKDIADWIVVFEFYGEIYAGVITDIADQEIFARLDTSLPGGNMRRGKMNLKLALSILNLASFGDTKYIWDPFCGQGGLIAVSLLFNQKPVICTDLSRAAIKDLRQNLDWIEKNAAELGINPEKSAILHIEKMEAQNLATASQESNMLGIIRKNFPKFDFKQTAIVTEGYLGPVFGQNLPTQPELYKILDEVEALWRQLLQQASILGIPEIIFCLPAYKAPNGEPYRIDLDQLFDGSQFELVELLPSKYFVDYSRPRSRVIHQIQKAVLKKNIE